MFKNTESFANPAMFSFVCDLTTDESRQCIRCAGVFISHKNNDREKHRALSRVFFGNLREYENTFFLSNKVVLKQYNLWYTLPV